MVYKDKEKLKEYRRQYYLNNKDKWHKKCEHQKIKTRCVECKGSEICEHNKQKSICKECGGSQICELQKQKRNCKECKGSEICEHNKQKSYCKECGGSQICEHNVQKYTCIECKGNGICEHQKEKKSCKNCNIFGYLVNLQRNRLRDFLRSNNISKTKPSIEYLDCSVEFFLEWIKNTQN